MKKRVQDKGDNSKLSPSSCPSSQRLEHEHTPTQVRFPEAEDTVDTKGIKTYKPYSCRGNGAHKQRVVSSETDRPYKHTPVRHLLTSSIIASHHLSSPHIICHHLTSSMISSHHLSSPHIICHHIICHLLTSSIITSKHLSSPPVFRQPYNDATGDVAGSLSGGKHCIRLPDLLPPMLPPMRLSHFRIRPTKIKVHFCSPLVVRMSRANSLGLLFCRLMADEDFCLMCTSFL